MLGFLVFKNIYFNLGEKCQNRVLGNIFGIVNVSVSDVSIKDKKIVFKLFSNGVFYQYVFILGTGRNKVLHSENIIDCVIFIFDDGDKDINKFIYCLAQCQDEYQVYQLLKKVL